MTTDDKNIQPGEDKHQLAILNTSLVHKKQYDDEDTPLSDAEKALIRLKLPENLAKDPHKDERHMSYKAKLILATEYRDAKKDPHDDAYYYAMECVSDAMLKKRVDFAIRVEGQSLLERALVNGAYKSARVIIAGLSQQFSNNPVRLKHELLYTSRLNESPSVNLQRMLVEMGHPNAAKWLQQEYLDAIEDNIKLQKSGHNVSEILESRVRTPQGFKRTGNHGGDDDKERKR